MNVAKLHLSPEEIQLVTDPGIILTKNSVMAKVVQLMAALSGDYRSVWEGAIAGAAAGGGASGDGVPGLGQAGAQAGDRAGGLADASPKISRGENYRGLPWVMLDYPRFFGREEVFAIRTMFWWGHGFSTTLHLKGKYKELYLPVIERHWMVLAGAGFHVGVSDDEWQHEHGDHNYRELTRVEDLRRPHPGGAAHEGGGVHPAGGSGDFLKLSAAVGLDRWETVPDVLTAMFKTLISVLF